MAKTKWRSGWLCRDQKKSSYPGMVGFFPRHMPRKNEGTYWSNTPHEERHLQAIFWWPDEFRAAYKKSDLPGYGKCIAVEMEL